MTKLLAGVLIAAICFSSSGIASYTQDSNTDLSQAPANVTVYSPEFPDAYVELSFTPAFHSREKDGNFLAGSVSATVFVEEQYADKNGQSVCVNSRLLSENEVNEMGRDNFSPLARTKETVEHGSLRLTLKVWEDISLGDYKVKYDLEGAASLPVLGPDGQDSPYSGDDFMMLGWGLETGYRRNNIDASGTCWDHTDLDVYHVRREDYGDIWSFLDKNGSHLAKNMITKATISSPTIGNGSTYAKLQYVHTYNEGNFSFRFPWPPEISYSYTGGSWTLEVGLKNVLQY